jgi:hypothetical protein
MNGQDGELAPANSVRLKDEIVALKAQMQAFKARDNQGRGRHGRARLTAPVRLTEGPGTQHDCKAVIAVNERRSRGALVRRAVAAERQQADGGFR